MRKRCSIDVRRKATTISIPVKSFTAIRYIPFPLDKIGHGISRGDVSSTVTGKTSSLLKNFLPFFLSFVLSFASPLVWLEKGGGWTSDSGRRISMAAVSCVRHRRFNTTFDWHPRPDLQRIRYPRAKDEGSKSVECSSGVGRPGQHVAAIYIRAPRLPSRPLPYRPTPAAATFNPRLVSFRRHNHRVCTCVCVCVTGTKTPYNLLERHDTPCRAAEIYIQPKSSLMLIVPKTVRYIRNTMLVRFFLLFLFSFSFSSYLSVTSADNDHTSSRGF